MTDTAKPSSELLSAIQSAETTVVLKDVTTVENPAAKHDIAMVGLVKNNDSILGITGISHPERIIVALQRNWRYSNLGMILGI